MPDTRGRYWAYSHDEEGELIEDFGNNDDLAILIANVADDVGYTNLVTLSLRDKEDMMKRAYRVVDNEKNHGETIWWAGPVSLLDRDR